MATPPRIGRTIADSTPAFTPAVRPPDGAPNVVMVVLDDTGFAQLGCFGSDIATPNIDRLAANGLRYQRFHVTALCSPTRACLLTGRNHHAVGMGFLADIPMGFPGYNARIPKSAATLPRILRDAGYSTMAIGKWHLAPAWELTASGPFDRWPLGLGFERYYGFLNGDTNQWTPNLVCDNHFVDPPRRPEDGYHLTEDLADQAIRCVLDQQQATPGKPFFLYFATGAMHAPHHVAPEWIEPYAGRFDDGWERWRERCFERQLAAGTVPRETLLTPRPSWVAAWDSLSDDERRLYARMHEVFAGFLTHTDHQIGRLVAALADLGVLDDTVIMVLSDNGASAEGGPHGSVNEHRFAFGIPESFDDNLAGAADLGGFRAYNHYAWGWAWAGNTPLRLWKRYTWLGGTRTPLIVHWPARIRDRGAVRPQFCHAVDLLPTVLDCAGIAAPAIVDGVTQQPIDGASLEAGFDDPAAPAPRSTQYFEMLGSRSIFHDGWKATTDHVSKGIEAEERLVQGSPDLETDRWSLFRLDDDFSEAVDRAESEPDRLRALVELWWAEAGRNQVLPLDDSLRARVVAMEPPPYPLRGRYEFRAGGGPVAEPATPMLTGGFRLQVHADVPTAGSDGVLCAQGDWSNGWAFLVLDGRLVWVLNGFGRVHRIVSESPVPSGAVELGFEFEREPTGGGAGRLLIDRTVVGAGRLPHDLPFRWQIGGAALTIGHDRGFPVCDDYAVPFAFPGTVRRVVFELPALIPRDPEREIEVVLKGE